MNKDVFDSLLALVGLCLIGGYLVRYAMKSKNQARMIEDTARSKVDTAAQGHGEFQGYAWPVGEPFPDYKGNGRVYYTFALQREETRGSGKNKRKTWVTVFSYGHYEPFYLVDPTGLALIDVRGAELNLSASKTRLWNNISNEEQVHMLKRDKIQEVPRFPPKTGFFGMFADKYQVVEREIPVGSPLFATGDYQAAGEDSLLVKESGLTDFTSKVIDIESRSFKDLTHLLDKNGDGKISEKEMKDGYTFAAALARNKAKQDPSKNLEKHFEVYGSLQTTPDHKLLIADVHEQFLVKRITRFTNSAMVLGYSLIALGFVTCFGLQAKNMQSDLRASRNIATANAKPNVAILHEKCVNNDLDSCRFLLDNESHYQLSKIHTKYYKGQLKRMSEKK